MPTMPQAPSSPVRLKDIAKELNVSVMTVSKVVRDCADVGAETRSRVLAKVKEMNYQPNWVARSLAARRTFMIGLIVPDLMHSFFAEIAKGVSETIRPLGYDVVICNSEEDSSLESSEVERLLARQVDGLMIASAQPASSTELFERIDARGVPYVLIDRRFADAQAPYVGTDDEAIGRMATRHLIERGCRRIAHIAGQPLTPGAGRLKGYRDALAAAMISLPESYVVEARDGARFAGRAGVPSNTFYEGGMDYGGMPAKPVREWVREMHTLKMMLKRQDKNKQKQDGGHD